MNIPLDGLLSPVLARLVTHYSTGVPQFLYGPVDVTIHRSAQKRVYVFYDRHVRTSSCALTGISLAEWLRLLIQRSRFVDVFLEIEYIHAGKPQRWETNKSYMNDLEDEFAECFKLAKTCPHRARFHYADIRSSSVFPVTQKLHQIRAMVNMLGEFTGFSTEEGMVESYRDLILKKYADYKAEKDPSSLLRDPKILRHLTPEVKTFVTRKLKAERMPTVDELGRSLEAGNFVEVADNFLEINAWLMDAYLLSRLMRIDNMSPPSEVAVIYAGSAHGRRYAEFLDSIGYVRDAHPGTMGTQCIPIPTLD